MTLMKRWGARIGLVLIALAVLTGLYFIPVDPRRSGHIWFVTAHNLLVAMGFILTLVASGIALVFLFIALVWTLWDAAK